MGTSTGKVGFWNGLPLALVLWSGASVAIHLQPAQALWAGASGARRDSLFAADLMGTGFVRVSRECSKGECTWRGGRYPWESQKAQYS